MFLSSFLFVVGSFLFCFCFLFCFFAVVVFKSDLLGSGYACVCSESAMPRLKRFGGKAKEYSPRARIRHWLG